MARADEYEGLNIQARLAAGLLAVESWLRAYELADAGVADVLDHMWLWLAVTPETFPGWYGFDSEALQAAETGDPLPAQTLLACQAREAPAADLAAMLADVVSIVYDSLFGALDLSLSLSRLRGIEAVAARSGIVLRPRSASPASGHKTSMDGATRSPHRRSPPGAAILSSKPLPDLRQAVPTRIPPITASRLRTRRTSRYARARKRPTRS